MAASLLSRRNCLLDDHTIGIASPLLIGAPCDGLTIVDEEAGISEPIPQILGARDPKATLRLVERLRRQLRERCHDIYPDHAFGVRQP